MIDAFNKDVLIVGAEANNWSGVAREYDFSEEESVFSSFLREFR